jgi:hypothetical protein
MNKIGEDIKDKYVILNPKFYRGEDKDRVFLCTGGFGCSNVTMGSAIFGTVVSRGIQIRVEGYELTRFETIEEIELAEKNLKESVIGADI